MTETAELIDELRSGVGSSGLASAARHAVNEPMIAHWCDAMGDGNPCYAEAGVAGASVHGGIVAPPMMLDVWDRPGLGPATHAGSPRGRVLDRLESEGYVSIVAVNTELEIGRYLRPGDVLSNIETLEDVSPLKRTALGSGHFVTTRHRYTTVEGEPVGSLMFRVLKFRPPSRGGAESEAPAPAPATGTDAGTVGGAPDPDPSLRPGPAENRDNAFFWDGTARHELRVQRCNGCGALLMPPGPCCPDCGSFDLGWVVSAGRGTLYSFAVPHYPQVRGFAYPLVVGLVELEEGVRIVSNLVGLSPGQLAIGMPLELAWLEARPPCEAESGAATGSPAVVLPQFRAPSPRRRTDTLQVAEVRQGDLVPLSSIPITATLVVSGAIATRDYTEVHHDRDIAIARGSKDIFLNINTSVGLLQRVVSDWAGPEAIFRSVRVRLGAPGYPGDLLTFSGSLRDVDPASGEVTLDMKASDALGDHLVASVELTLPVAGAGIGRAG
jgi:uncharacterized OB-fold protein